MRVSILKIRAFGTKLEIGQVPMPVKTKDGGDKADGEGFTEESSEHEGQGGEKLGRSAELQPPMAVREGPGHSGKGQHHPQRRLKPRMPRRRHVADVVDAHVQDRHCTEPSPAASHRQGIPSSTSQALPWIQSSKRSHCIHLHWDFEIRIDFYLIDY